ncbi:LysR substrate-binding domain-containing protein [uncultured Roseibium sp.]|uniref:LysR substrate-binding domain-containing protein n=1 Tax=uncultured Roseibium sp. TaxID=1936171 RepID=UPI0032167CDE
MEEARHILGLLQSADDAAAGAATRPRGRLRITCPNEFGRIHVMPVLTGYLDTYRDVSAEIVMIDRIVNIVEEGFDIAVRIGPLQSSGLTAVRIGQVRRVVCATPAYLAENGAPQTPQDLQGHRVISAGPVGPLPDWRFGGDRPVTVRIASRLAVSNIAAGIEVACQGWGLCRALSYQVAPQLETGILRRVLEEFEPDPLPVHLVHVEGRRAAAKVRSFLDYAAPRLKSLPVLG